MNPQRFFMPGYMGIRNASFSAPMIGSFGSVTRNPGLFSKITNGIRSINWGGILNNANKTLNVVNQAIPLVRQAGPMVNNMRSMLRIAKAFGSETNSKNHKNYRNNLSINNDDSKMNEADNLATKKEVIEDNVPNFFI